MKTLNYSVRINASKELVWNSMFEKIDIKNGLRHFNLIPTTTQVEAKKSYQLF